jgi:hypothetical protein
MAVESGSPGFSIPADLVELILLGPEDDRRQLQDSPILGDVWLAYAAAPGEIEDLLITPYKETTAGRVAKEIAKRVRGIGRHGRTVKTAGVAYLQGIVAARLYFDEVLRVLVPLTLWWHERKVPATLKAEHRGRRALAERIVALFDYVGARKARPAGGPIAGRFTALDRYVALAGLILWAAGQKKAGAAGLSTGEVLRRATADVDRIVRALADLFTGIANDRATAGERLIFQISLNRRAGPALDRSVPAVKADAARTLFNVSCARIAWAVLDSGVDAGHDAFAKEDGKSRVRKTYDFTRIRDLVASDGAGMDSRQLRELLAGVELEEREARARIKKLARDAEDEKPVDWDLVEALITVARPEPPRTVHGTHVAGIIGAEGKRSGYASGMCPDIQLYDFRVLSKSLDDTEFAVIAALQFIRYLNQQHTYTTIHGANLSLSIPHSVRNYACGQTPVCLECERLVDTGVTVVAAAGNRGYQRFETKDGTYEGYAAFSITDPGNADGVITVGSTHPNAPHAYGVSFFSSRGPTGDGRLKPDLVAPGERIQAPYPGNNEWGTESGTSMAAPHVSGAAAMLMARYPELIGQPRRIKQILCTSATDLGRERSFQGHGLLDVLRAFQSL